MKSLIAFSSGYDSLYIAWKYLTETDNEVTLCFMDMSLIPYQEEVELYVNPFQKYNAKKSHKWMKENLRDHELKIQFIDKMEHKYDHAKTFVKLGAQWINEGLYDEVVHGSNDLSYRGDITVTRNVVMQHQFDSIAKRGVLTFPFRKWKKHIANLMDELPKEMRHLVVSCNFADVDDLGNFVECGNCHKCFRNKTIGDQLKNGFSPDEAMENYMNTEKAKAINDSFFESKDRWGYFDEVK